MKTFFTTARVQLISIIISSLAVLISAISIFLTIQVIRHQQTKDSADLVLRIDDNLGKDKFIALIDSLDTDDVNTKILQSSGGFFSELLVDDYLSQYEALDVLYKENLIDHEMANQMFSYDIENAYKNVDIQNMIKNENNSYNELWSGFIHLAKEFK